MRTKTIYLVLLLLLAAIMPAFTQDIPDRPNPPRLVNDFAGMLNEGQVNALEQKLVAFNDSTSTQIAIVTVSSLGEYDKSDYAQRLAEKWGIGQKGLDNGVLILVKPKSGSSAGQVQIAPGYGLEGAIPDITAGEIVDYELLPAFREGDYYGGLERATNTLMALASGEFTAEEYGQKTQGSPRSDGSSSSIFIVLLVIFLIIMFSKKGGGGGRNRKITTRSDLPFWLLMSMLGSGNRHRGSWGGFSGGGGFGQGGGGFGGFGGGSFGGGGAGGSW